MSTPVSTRPEASDNAAAPPDTWTQRGRKQEPPARWKPVRSPRRIPYLLLGAVLVIGCAAAAVIVSMQLDNRQSVLVLARPATVGQVLSLQDVQQVAVSADVGLDAVRASESSTVLGQPLAYSMPAGALLTHSSVGAPAIPMAGQAVAAVGLKAGQFPPSLAPGARVAVLVSAATAPSAGAPDTNGGQAAAPIAQWTATVIDVGPGQDRQNTVVSLQLADADARELAVAPAGRINLVALSGEGS